MRAAIYYGTKDLRVEDIPEPDCKSGQVKVAPAFCGICGTDVHEWDGGPTFCPRVGEPHPITGESLPIGFGHEFSGVIKEIGEGIEGLTVGQNVTIKPNLQCNTCRACQSGYATACESMGFLGLHGGGGGLSETVIVQPHMVFPLPAQMPLEIGALVEPLAVGWHAVSMSGMMPGDRVLVLGGGPIGLAVLQAVKARQVDRAVVAEVAPARQQFAQSFGADYIVNPLVEDTVMKTKELLGGWPDVVFECAGVPASFSAATKVIKGRGTIVNVALWEKPTLFLPNELVAKESRIIGILGYDKGDFESVLEALEKGVIKPEGMITKKIRLEDVVKEGIETILKERDRHVKIMIDIHA